MSNRYKGAIISATPPTTTGGESGVASGAWTLEQQMQLQAAGLWPSQPLPKYIEDVFSTYLYTGNGSTQTITNGIDLSTKGGLVWQKERDSTGNNHALMDTLNGGGNFLQSNNTNALATGYTGSFSSTGFTTGTFSGNINNSAKLQVSWTFREQPKFFDIVTYTGNGSNRTIAHNLGSVPGCIIIKRTDAIEDWNVYHRSLANTQYLNLGLTAAALTGTTRWNSTTPTDTVFSLGTSTGVNASGGTYVAYIFAHDAGGFGLTGTDNVISCGSFTNNGSGNATVSLGYEPQWVMIKNITSAENWYVNDIMRGMPTPAANQYLIPNTSGAEATGGAIAPTSTGFAITGLTASATYIYIAIRRGPMKVPTDATKVFSPNALTTAPATFNIGFPLDLIVNQARDGGQALWGTRLQGPKQYLDSSSTAAEVTAGTAPWAFDKQNDSYAYYTPISVAWNFRRAPGFFDEVAGPYFNGNLSHNLGVVPELVIVKQRDGVNGWYVWTTGFTTSQYLFLNSTAAIGSALVWNTMTSTQIGLQNLLPSNTGVYYLFATCPGVSKVGSYTGTGAAQTINCGFTGGARFVLIKRTDSTGDWYVWDSARGIIPSNDPYLLINSTAAEVTGTDYVDTTNVGFDITSTAPAAINANGGTFIFLAIA